MSNTLSYTIKVMGSTFNCWTQHHERKELVKFDIDELALILALVSKLDPNKYATDEAKAVIYKCKAAIGRDLKDKP